MRFISGFIAALVLLALSAGLAVFGGWYDVAALGPRHPFTAWALHTTMETSVRRHAQSIVAPNDLPARVARGFQDFDEMCVQCHGAPGRERDEVGKGLRPQAPSLVEAVARWKPQEIFWIVKNGVHMTGMPAFGPTHADGRLWDIVAFVASLKEVTPELYGQMRASLSDKPHDHHDDADIDHAHHHHD
jgi:mono/diheme cytochrome c family protein